MTSRLRIPSKTFFVGEYVAMCGGPAVVLVHGPCFQAHEAAAHPTQFNARSPAGLWLSRQLQKTELSFDDPWQGAGGFGASGAQFLAVRGWGPGEVPREALRAWEDYCGTVADGSSGYDVLSQRLGRVAWIPRDKSRVASVTWPWADWDFLVTPTGRKLETHSHLRETRDLDVSPGEVHVEAVMAAWVVGDAPGVAEGLGAFRRWLMSEKLEAPHTSNWLAELAEAHPKLVWKGCGALGSDSVLGFGRTESVAEAAAMLEATTRRRVVRSKDLTSGGRFELAD